MPLNLYFSWHTVEAFTPAFRELFSCADVFVNEHGWNSGRVEYEERLYNKLAKGEANPEELMKKIPDDQTDPAFYETLYGIIFRSEKKILLERSPLTLFEALADLAEIELGNVALNEKLRNYERALQRRAAFHRKRDECFASLLDEYCKPHPNNNVLVMRGCMHQRALEKFLTDRSVGFKSHVSHTPLPLHFNLEIVSKLEVGLDINRRELLEALVEHIELSSEKYDLKTMKMSDLIGVQSKTASLSDTKMEQLLSS